MKIKKIQLKYILITIITLLLILAGIIIIEKERVKKKNIIYFGMPAGSYWNVPNGNCYEVVDAAIANFEKKYPGIEVKYVSGILKEDYPEWLSEQIVLGKEPDVFMIPRNKFDKLASLKVLKRLDDLISRDMKFHEEAYYKSAFDYGNIRDGQYALPYECVPKLMFVNKTLLEKEGISMPTSQWTWDDFISICRKVTKDIDGNGVIDQYGCFDYNWREAVYSNGASLFDENGTTSFFGDQKVETAIKFIKELNQINQGYIVTSKDFDKGHVAFRPFDFSEYRTYKPYPWRIKKYSEFEWDCIKLPSGPAGSGQSQLDTLLIGVSSRTKNELLAWELLKELCYEEETQLNLLKASQGVPVIKKVVASPQFKKVLGTDTPNSMNIDTNEIMRVMEDTVKMPNFQKYPNAMEVADTDISSMISGDVSLDNGLLKLQREINGMLK